MLSASQGHSSTISADRRLPLRDLSLELSPSQADTVRLSERAHVLRRRGRRCCVH